MKCVYYEDSHHVTFFGNLFISFPVPANFLLSTWQKKNFSICSPMIGYHIYNFLRNSPQWARTSSITRFLDHTQRRTTVGRTPLGELLARLRDLYQTTHSTHNRQNIHAPGGFRTHKLSRQAAADLRLRPCGHWDRLKNLH